MSQFEDKHLDFVLRHYEKGRFDTQKAVRRFNDAHPVEHRPHKGWWLGISGMAAAAAVLIGVFLFLHREERRWTELTAEAAAKTAVLPDGTRVTLSQGSTLSFKAEDPREVKMTGKIFFDVARDEADPFEIHAEGAYVRVLGTEFQVDGSTPEEGISVYVADGKVLFSKSSRSEGVILTEGMEARLAEGAQIPVVEEDADVNSIAWQRGTFIFNETSLKEVLDCLSAYYHVSFAATDLDRKLSGEFYTDDLDLILSLIESALDVTIVKK